jgi:hypothetical protein
LTIILCTSELFAGFLIKFSNPLITLATKYTIKLQTKRIIADDERRVLYFELIAAGTEERAETQLINCLKWKQMSRADSHTAERWSFECVFVNFEMKNSRFIQDSNWLSRHSRNARLLKAQRKKKKKTRLVR